jgi:hypothetical protein
MIFPQYLSLRMIQEHQSIEDFFVQDLTFFVRIKYILSHISSEYLDLLSLNVAKYRKLIEAIAEPVPLAERAKVTALFMAEWSKMQE